MLLGRALVRSVCVGVGCLVVFGVCVSFKKKNEHSARLGV